MGGSNVSCNMLEQGLKTVEGVRQLKDCGMVPDEQDEISKFQWRQSITESQILWKLSMMIFCSVDSNSSFLKVSLPNSPFHSVGRLRVRLLQTPALVACSCCIKCTAGCPRGMWFGISRMSIWCTQSIAPWQVVQRWLTSSSAVVKALLSEWHSKPCHVLFIKIEKRVRYICDLINQQAVVQPIDYMHMESAKRHVYSSILVEQEHSIFWLRWAWDRWWRKATYCTV